jgi:hypothetical protein
MGKTIIIRICEQLTEIGFCKNDWMCSDHPIMYNYSIDYETKVSCFSCEYFNRKESNLCLFVKSV